MRRLQLCGMAALLAAVPPLMVGCGDDDDTPPATGGVGGTGGTGGSSGTSGTGGTGGTSGSGATGGTAGTAGTAGTGGSAGDGGLEGCDARPTTVVDLPADITAAMTLDNKNVYKLASGGTFVLSGATLTIPPCTTIVGGAGSALVVTRGGKIEAAGEANRPIVFTSERPIGMRAPGDWGGIVLLGRAAINQQGGEAAIEGLPATVERGRYGQGASAPANDESSGTLKYVRIEFAGFKFGMNNELNGLTMGGVGSGTTIDYVMINQPLDDGFEWFGGTVNASHLVVNDTAAPPGGGDDCFDADFGYVGKVTTFLARKGSGVGSSNDPNGFEWDNTADGTTLTPRTNPTFEKGTLCGKDLTAAQNSSYGAVFRRATQGTVKNTVWTGWKFAFDIRNSPDTAVEVTNSIVAMGTSIDNPAATSGFDEPAWFNDSAKNNSTADPGFTADDCFAAPGSAEFKRVTDSNKGAFEGDAKWLEGAWLDWSTN